MNQTLYQYKSHEKYVKRIMRNLWLTFIFYVILVIYILLSLSSESFLFFEILLITFLCLDIYRRVNWYRFSLLEITTNNNGIELTYLDKDIKKNEIIPWRELNVGCGSTFTKGISRTLIFQFGRKRIEFMNSSTKDLTNDLVKELDNNINKIKKVCC